MRRVVLVLLMVAVAIAVGVLAVRAVQYPEGIRTSGITIGSTTGEGEGEGEPTVTEDVLRFEGDRASVQFAGAAPEIQFDGFSSIVHMHGGYDFYGGVSGNGAYTVAGTPDMYDFDFSADYLSAMISTSLAFMAGDTGIVMLGRAVDTHTGQAAVDGVSLWAMDGSQCGRSEAAILLRTSGGLTPEPDEVGTEWAPVVETALFVKPADDASNPGECPPPSSNPARTASVSLLGNEAEGEIVLANFHQDEDNSVNASFTIDRHGSVIIQLGGESSGNTDTLRSGSYARPLARASSVRSAAVTPDPVHQRPAVPSIHLQSLLNSIPER